MRTIVIVEDSEEDFAAIQRVFRRVPKDIQLVWYRDGDSAMKVLADVGGRMSTGDDTPVILLLDLNLPGINGREILARIKRDVILKSVPVVIFSTSSSPKDIAFCYEQGANGYMVKPVNFTQFEKKLLLFSEYWTKAMILPSDKGMPVNVGA
jgi:CheY-like chemotaxis protein